MRNTLNLPFFLFIFGIALGLSSCHKKNRDNRYDNHFALAVGNSWLYDEFYYYPDTAPIPSHTEEVKMEIVKDTLIDNGQQAYIIEQSYLNHGTSRMLLYQVGNELRERHMRASELGYSVLFKRNMQEGMEWTFAPSANNQEFNTRKVIGIQPDYEFLNTRAYVVEVQHGNPDLKEPGQYGELATDIYAPGIGLIESNYVINYFGPSRTKRVLKAFTIQ